MDERLWRSWGDEVEKIFLDEASQLVNEHLGPEFEIDAQARPGSISVWVWLSVGGGAVFKAIKDYPEFVEGLNLLLSHLQKLLNTLFGEVTGGLSVRATVGDVQPGATVYVAQTSAAFSSVLNQHRNFLLYIAAITTILLVLVVGVGVFLLTRLL